MKVLYTTMKRPYLIYWIKILSIIPSVIGSIDSYNRDMHEVLSILASPTFVMPQFTSLSIQNLHDIINDQI